MVYLNERLCSGGSSQLTVLLAQEFAYLLFTNMVIVKILAVCDTCRVFYTIKLTEIHLKLSIWKETVNHLNFKFAELFINHDL